MNPMDIFLVDRLITDIFSGEVAGIIAAFWFGNIAADWIKRRMGWAMMLLVAAANLHASTIDSSIIWGSGPDLFHWECDNGGCLPISKATGRAIDQLHFGEIPQLPPQTTSSGPPNAPWVSESLHPPVAPIVVPNEPPAQQDTPEPGSGVLIIIGAIFVSAQITQTVIRRRIRRHLIEILRRTK